MRYLPAVILGLVVVVALALGNRSDAPNSRHYIQATDIVNAQVDNEVYGICQASRQNYGLVYVNECRQAQTITNTEFLCDSQALNAWCWVETP